MVARLLLPWLALTIFVATGEIALRVVYRDAGKRTPGGPGGRSFEHISMRDDQRGRLEVGPKTPGKPRIMIVGDSITWGQGVREWRDTWPEQLARALESAGTAHEMAVVAMPGRDIPSHVQEVERWIPQVNPDVFIYQWYVNDIEVEPRRPPNMRRWQQWSGHESLRRWSYLYYFLDNRLATYVPPERTYVDYILQDYAPGTLEWAEFERYFHTLAMRAKEIAPARLLVIYPQVPFRGTSPLQSVYDRVIALARPHRLAIPPAAWIRYGGTLTDRSGATPRPALVLKTPVNGPVIDTRDYYLPGGPLDVTVTVSIDATLSPRTLGASGTPGTLGTPSTPGTPGPPGPLGTSGTLGTLDVVDPVSNEALSSSPLTTPQGRGWQEVAARITVPERARHVRLRVTSSGVARFSLAQITIPVDYGFAVVDLTASLNTFNTHTSIFDAHPNERAHKVVAEKVFKALQKIASRR